VITLLLLLVLVLERLLAGQGSRLLAADTLPDGGTCPPNLAHQNPGISSMLHDPRAALDAAAAACPAPTAASAVVLPLVANCP